MNKLELCPKCNSWLSYDDKSKEYFCTSCDYSEFEKWEFTKKFRLELD